MRDASFAGTLGWVGLEPTTNALKGRCSTIELPTLMGGTVVIQIARSRKTRLPIPGGKAFGFGASAGKVCGRMKRRTFLRGGLAGTALALSSAVSANRKDAGAAAATVTPDKSFEFEEMPIAQLQEAMRSGRHTSRTITEAYSERIQKVDKRGPTLNSVIELNPDAIAIAE